MKQKNVKVKNKKHYSQALIHSILTNYNFLLNFCRVCLINNDTYFNFDNLVDFIYYCKLNNKYTSLINKIYIMGSHNSFKITIEILEQNNIIKTFKNVDETNPSESNLTVFINEGISLNKIYANEEVFNEMQSFFDDYNKYIYESLITEDPNNKKLVK